MLRGCTQRLGKDDLQLRFPTDSWVVYPQTFYMDLNGLICKAIEESRQNILYASAE
jgi:hypothetical protein